MTQDSATFRALTTPRAARLEGAPLASFRARAAAFLIDFGIVLVIVV
jgi:hypothetical protein